MPKTASAKSESTKKAAAKMKPLYLVVDADGDWAFEEGTGTPDGFATTDGDGELAFDAAAVSGRTLRRQGFDTVAF